MTTCRGKKRFASCAAAIKIIDQARDARKHGRLTRQERRVFRCELCKGWHVTSEPYRHGAEA